MTTDPDPEPTFLISYIVALVILLILSAFFSLSETAYTSANLIRLENQSKKSKAAKAALNIANNYDRFLSTVLIGNNIVNLSASALAAVLFIKYFGDIGATLSTIVLTIAILIFGEIAPKSVARERPEFFAKLNAYPLYFFFYLLWPISFVMMGVSKLSKAIFKQKEEKAQLTEEEFSMLVEDMNEDGVLNDIEEDIIQKTIEYGDCKVQDIMTKAKDVAHIKGDLSLEKIKEAFVESNYSRLVVCKTNSLQTAYGVILQKDLFEFLVKGEKDLKKIIILDPVVTKPTNKVSRLLKKLQSERQHLAIVKNGEKVVGIITMEDILEELVGEIKDENDDD